MSWEFDAMKEIADLKAERDALREKVEKALSVCRNDGLTAPGALYQVEQILK